MWFLKRKARIPRLSTKKALLFALHLILLDVLWGVIASVIGLSLVLLVQTIPSRTLCTLLESESKSTLPFRLSNYSILIEVFWNSSFYLIPVVTFFLLVEEKKQESWGNYIMLVFKRWRKVMIAVVCFAGFGVCYRVAFFFLFTFRENPKPYPSWFSLPLHINGLVGPLYVINRASKSWTASKTANLVLQEHLPQLVVEESKKVEKSFRKRMIMSFVLPSLYFMVLRELIINVFHVSEESDRATLIVVTTLSCYPLWLLLDRLGQKPIPWSDDVKTAPNSENTTSNSDHTETTNLSKFESKDPFMSNGMALSSLVVSGTVITVRLLQANMDTMISKLLTGFLASSLESTLVVLKPYIVSLVHRILWRMKRTFLAVKISISTNPTNIADTDAAKEREEMEKNYTESRKRVYKWHRAHILVLVNRLEMFSIIFSNILMMMAARVKNQAMLKNDSNVQDCSNYKGVGDFVVALVVLCSLEFVIEFITYFYLLKFESLRLKEVTNRRKFKISFIFFAIIVIMYYVDTFLTMGYTVLSCSDVDPLFYEYHCLEQS